jgi:SAM-dependent methyltransferase
LALVGAAVTWTLVHRIRDVAQRSFAAARKRTLARYGTAPPSVRGYVSSKLRTDPSLRSIAALPGSFGRVVDAGCGYGQIGIALIELGRAETVTGFDDDQQRIAVASGAGGTQARFEAKTLVDVDFPEADTVLFVDSLHYLPIQAQDALLERAARALAPGGRIVVRDIDSGTSVRSSLTEAAERLAARFRGRSIDFGFRSTTDLVGTLGRLGLVPAKAEHVDWSMTNNVLTVATKPASAADGSMQDE